MNVDLKQLASEYHEWGVARDFVDSVGTVLGDVSVRVLNRAFAADPDAIHALICNRVQCNQALADDPTVVVEGSLVGLQSATVGVLGILNGVLGEMGLPLVAVQFEGPRENGRMAVVGFQAYAPPEETSV